MPNFFLVRHGESLGNVDLKAHKEYGDVKLPLTELGALQAAYTGNFLREYFMNQILEGNEPKVLIIQSPYERAWHTADCIDTVLSSLRVSTDTGVSHPLVVGRQQHVGLREKDYGHWDGVPESDYESIDPNAYKSLKHLEENGLYFYAKMSGGESAADVWGRCKAEAIPSIYRFVEQYDVTDVVVVSHGMTTRGLLAALLNVTVPLHEYYNELRNPPNASVHFIEDAGPGNRVRAGKNYGIRAPLEPRLTHKDIIFDPNDHIPEASRKVLMSDPKPVRRYDYERVWGGLALTL